MTTPMDQFERGLPDALADLASPRTPEYMADILGQTARTRQRPTWVAPGRWPSMRTPVARFVLIGALALLVATVGGALFIASRPDPRPIPRHAIVTGDLVPTDLLHLWVGSPRRMPLIGDPSAGMLILNRSDLMVTDDHGQTYASRAVLTDDGALLVQSAAIDAWCADGTVGRYEWSVSDTGHALMLSASHDPCAARQAVLAGAWALRPQEDRPCFHRRGALADGTFRSVSFEPAAGDSGPGRGFGHVTYTVPSGWTNIIDSPVAFGLAPTTAALAPGDGDIVGTRGGILLLARPAVIDHQTCDLADDTTVSRSADGIMSFIVGSSNFDASVPRLITLAGMRGVWSDIGWASSGPAPCGAVGSTILSASYGPMSQTLTLAAGARMRLFLLDRADGEVMAIAITSTSSDRFDMFVAEAMPILELLTID